MTIRIAVAGKGGTGKTTFCSLLIQELLNQKKTPILAVDSDPNSGLGEALGVKYTAAIADIRDEVRDGKKIPQGMAKSDYINMKLSEIIVESPGIDLLVMGRPEGRECYCYINELLRNFVSNITKNYCFVVMDNEAGMEHLSRRTTDNIDVLYIISEQTQASLRSVVRVYEITKNIKLKIKKICLVLAKVKDSSINFYKLLKEAGIPAEVELVGVMPYSDSIVQLSEKGSPITAADDAISCEIRKIIQKTVSF